MTSALSIPDSPTNCASMRSLALIIVPATKRPEVEAHRESRVATLWERRPAAMRPGLSPQRSRSPRHRIAAGRRSDGDIHLPDA